MARENLGRTKPHMNMGAIGQVEDGRGGEREPACCALRQRGHTSGAGPGAEVLERGAGMKGREKCGKSGKTPGKGLTGAAPGTIVRACVFLAAIDPEGASAGWLRPGRG